MRKLIRSLVATALLAALLTSVAYASTYGKDSFMYHRYGVDFGPTYRFNYTNGTESPVTSPDSQDIPPYARRFAPSSSNTNLSQYINNQTWLVSSTYKWDYNIGTAFSQFEANKPMTGENFLMLEAHVNRGWKWLGYYTDLPDTVKSHILANAIYKPNHVECDLWTTNPEQLVQNNTYETRWIFVPEVDGTLHTLPKSYGHGFGIYLYRWWNAKHVASSHGEPMDKISWRDDLGTFGYNVSSSISGHPYDESIRYDEPASNIVYMEIKPAASIGVDHFLELGGKLGCELASAEFFTESGKGELLISGESPEEVIDKVQQSIEARILGINSYTVKGTPEVMSILKAQLEPETLTTEVRP